jgi:ribosomal protein S14
VDAFEAISRDLSYLSERSKTRRLDDNAAGSIRREWRKEDDAMPGFGRLSERTSESYEAEIARLREALQPFAFRALIRKAETCSDEHVVEVTMDMCRAAFRALIRKAETCSDEHVVEVTMDMCRAALKAMQADD